MREIPKIPEIKKISEGEWKIEKQGQMKAPLVIFASEKLLEGMKKDRTLIQGMNVASLPGIQKQAMIMPDGHEGYGFPIGGVAGLDVDEGGISPGGIGYDINCGVRLLKTNLKKEKVYEKIREVLVSLFKNVPSGLGSSNLRITPEQLDEVLEKGAAWAVENNYGNQNDLDNCESNGCMKEANAKVVSQKAKSRGMKQLGSLGAGNHFLEVQSVEDVYDEETAKAFGLEKGTITIMIHCGSRGLGHQVCSDYLREMEDKLPEIVAKIPDKELIYAPASHPLCKKYYSAMAASANFAWCNRHMIAHYVRKAMQEVFPSFEAETVYDVAHNICKIEEHIVDGEKKKLYVHRKGSTRAFGPGRSELSDKYKKTGQPILLPGSMGTGSYVLVGTPESEKVSFASTAHGAGRCMSRKKALQTFRSEDVTKELEKNKIYVKSASRKGVAEEAPGVYKNVDEVAEVSNKTKIGKLVVRVRPIGVIKG